LIIIQGQINEKSITLIIKGSKLTAKILAKAMKLVIDKHKNDKLKKQTKVKHGKQRVKDIVRQGVGVTNVEITDANIKSFKPIAGKYGVDYALKKDTTEDPPKWIDPLSGLLYCKDCGSKLHIRTDRRKYEYRHIARCSEYVKGKSKGAKCFTQHQIDCDTLM